ncbi:unnamed protein product [Chrysodeixis includens]|uniref:DUF1349 domain-containing protein n=1 Tax=Chrysodeixis includens TaxID=689277 RepID=A0A9P0FWN5_CHRIL|nr:unnamed protein product [Chrysodeixis includens]
MESKNFSQLKLEDFKWINEPKEWKVTDNAVEMTTGYETDFWRETYVKFIKNDGHLFGVEIKDDFTFTACIEADYSELYDQAGLMIYWDETHWLKAGIEYNDGAPVMSSVLTNGVSDWGSGIFSGNPRKFYLRVTRKDDVICVKYSTDNKLWLLLRMCPMKVMNKPCLVGPMSCTPKRAGLKVKYSEMSVTVPAEDILHSN